MTEVITNEHNDPSVVVDTSALAAAEILWLEEMEVSAQEAQGSDFS